MVNYKEWQFLILIKPNISFFGLCFCFCLPQETVLYLEVAQGFCNVEELLHWSLSSLFLPASEYKIICLLSIDFYKQNKTSSRCSRPTLFTQRIPPLAPGPLWYFSTAPNIDSQLFHYRNQTHRLSWLSFDWYPFISAQVLTWMV